MPKHDPKSGPQQDRPEQRVYRLTEEGRETKSRPSGRVSRGFLRLLSVLDGKQDLQSIQVQLTFLSIADLVLWCEELTRLNLIERIDRKDADAGFSYTGGIDFERDPEFNSAVEQICAALDRTQPMADRSRTDAPRFVTAHTARLVAIETLNTTRNMTLNGFFAYPSRRVDGKVKPSEFRILIVQDDRLETQKVNLIASKEGYITAVAQSLVSFRGALRAQLKPDLVLLDVDLPDGNGFQELQMLRSKAEYAKLCVVMLTARSTQADIAQGVMLGANGYVTKPYTPAALLAAIRKALNLE
jgi:two-component system chemotaxis response regulator CheY